MVYPHHEVEKESKCKGSNEKVRKTTVINYVNYTFLFSTLLRRPG